MPMVQAMTLDLEEMLKAAASAVFPTMLNMQVTFMPPNDAMAGESFVAGTIGFTGNFSAVLYLSTTSEFARKMTGSMLGLSDSKIEGNAMVNDALGELTNMHAGHVKTRLCDKRIPCCMTIPTVIRGSEFKIRPITGFQKLALWVCSGSEKVTLALLYKQP
jgi:chemotaxis protein CheX